MEKLLSADEVAKLFPSRRRNRTIHPEQVYYYVRTGVKVGNRRIKLKSRESPGRMVFAEADVQSFLDELTKARQAEKAKRDPTSILRAEGVLP